MIQRIWGLRMAVLGAAMVLAPVISQSAPGQVPAPSRNLARTIPAAPATLIAGRGIRGQLRLQAGSLQARIENFDHETTVRAGASVFIDIILSNDSARRMGDAQLLLVGTGARLVRVQGKGVRSHRAGDGHIIAAGRLGPGAEKAMVIELRLVGTDPPADEAKSAGRLSRATVRLAVRSGREPTSATGSTELAWSVANPAKDYHRALIRLEAAIGPEMYASIKEARVGKSGLPRKWLFKPVARKPKRSFRTVQKSVSERYCTSFRFANRAERRRARRRGRRAKRQCTRRATRTVVRRIRVPVQQKDAVVTRQELRLLELAHNAVRTGGAAPLMRKQGGRYGWTVTRLAVDLRTYLRQQPHPALCTGMTSYMDYLKDITVGFQVRAGEMHKFRARAPAMAAHRVRTLRERLRTVPGGHPGWGAAPLAILTPFPQDADVLMSLPQIAGHIVSLTVSREDGARVSNASDSLDAFRLALQAIRSRAFTAQPATVKRAARRALTLLEAAHYLRIGDGHYVRVEKALYGGIESIRKAHSETCVPGS